MAEACLTALQSLPPSLQHKVSALLGLGDATRIAAGTSSSSQVSGNASRAEESFNNVPPDCEAGSGVSTPLRLDGGVLIMDGFLKSADVQVSSFFSYLFKVYKLALLLDAACSPFTWCTAP